MVRFAIGLLLNGVFAIFVSAQSAVILTQNNDARGAQLPERISVSFNKTPLREAVLTIAKRSGSRIIFADDLLPSSKVVYKANSVTPDIALSAVLRGTGIKANRIPGGGFELVDGSAEQSTKAVGVLSGKVTDAKTGRGISGAKVSAGNGGASTSSLEDGSYSLTVTGTGNYIITVRLVGYIKQTKNIVIGESARLTANFQLEPSTNVLDQVVVTGTATATELKAVPNAITIVTSKQIEERGITRIDQLFKGDIPGLFAVTRGSDALLDQVLMFSRGATSISNVSAGVNTNTNPIKTYIDGIEMADPSYLSQIDPTGIERIEIIAGPQASTIYGSNAINGVMQIFTKRGSSNTPRVTINALTGFIQNNFSDALAPQHDFNAQASGVQGQISYNLGGAWNYVGAWTPAKRISRLNGFGGMRLTIPTSAGSMTGDVSIRRSNSNNKQRGAAGGVWTELRSNGWYQPFSFNGGAVPTMYTLGSQTMGFELDYAPFVWWSHEFGMGSDAEDVEQRSLGRGYLYLEDTTLTYDQTRTSRRSLRYSTTLNVPLSSLANATIVAGADEWQKLTSTTFSQTQRVTGAFTDYIEVSRRPDHNTGGFLQAQVSVLEKLFLTYGLRAEWNPGFGEEAEPNLAPRYGIAYTNDFGPATAKLRASYGRSTRPPQADLKNGVQETNPFITEVYGQFFSRSANPDLEPEHQQGYESGLELYFGQRGSLAVTHYNQTVSNIIEFVPGIDSVRSLQQDPIFFGSSTCADWVEIQSICSSQDAQGYAYAWIFQYGNIGSLRNRGWELQGSLTVGPVTTKGTYSWTRSRSIGLTPRFRDRFSAKDFPQYFPGASFSLLPEHTWSLVTSYGRANTTVSINLNGTGIVPMMNGNELYAQHIVSMIRLNQNKYIMNKFSFFGYNRGYATADLNASHRFSRGAEGVLQVQNIGNQYQTGYYSQSAVIGRQTKAGIRLRF